MVMVKPVISREVGLVHLAVRLLLVSDAMSDFGTTDLIIISSLLKANTQYAIQSSLSYPTFVVSFFY